MPQVRAEFNYQPSADAQRYEIFYGTQRLGFSDTLQFTTDLELEYGTHNFSVRGVNVDGTGPFRSTQVVLEEPYVPLPTPGPIGALEVSLVILGGGVGGGEPPVEPPSGEPYDLTAGGTRTIPFDHQWPTAPTTTRSVTVTSASQFNSEAAIDGTQITVGSSFSGAISILGNDIDIVMSNAFTITGNLTIGGASYANRIRWEGGNVNGVLSMPRGRDLLFDDWYILGTGTSTHNLTAASQPFNRVAFINTTLEFQPTGGTDGWSLYMQPTGYLGNGQSSDLILANAKLISGGQNNRMQDVDNIIIVDSITNPTNTSTNGMRLHYGCDQVYIANTISIGLFKMDAAGVETIPSATNVTYDRHDRYYNGGYVFQGSKANTGTVSNSRHHGLSFGISPLTDGGGNDLVAWDGSTIDYSRITGKSSAADFGAQR